MPKKKPCKYCGAKTPSGDLCCTCYGKRKVVRKLLALGQVIRECVKKERESKRAVKWVDNGNDKNIY